ncbi:phage replication protein O [Lutibacter oricola]|uniref:Phage replication protein O n=1 Tax=Lutibacter oricola TaxID=762486 RepID=A0A1H2WNZ8_9FLAO|nr:replication protein [Lutibacter oricola]SDW81994.1 phage replication protein O [Lutibacter oricola]
MTLKNTTPVPNVFFDSVISSLSGSAIRVYLKIVRNTYGWRDQNGNIKSRDWIAHSQFEKLGLSNRSVTNGVQELIDKHLIIVTDESNTSLINTQARKYASKVFYALPVIPNENSTLDNVKDDKTKPQNLRTTKEISLQKYKASERIPDNIRIQQIQGHEIRKQQQRNNWL